MYYADKPYVEKIVTIRRKKNRSDRLHYITLEKIRHPETQDHFTACLVETSTWTSPRTRKTIAPLEDVLLGLSQDNKIHAVIAPEYLYQLSDSIFSEQEKNEILHRYQEATKRTKSIVIPGTIVWSNNGALVNSAFLFCHGKVVGRYDKMYDGGESDYAKKLGMSYSPGRKEGIFIWHGLRLGIEICADTGILAKRNITGLDLYFLISCGMTDVTLSCLRKGGYCLVNDGRRPTILLPMLFHKGKK